VKWRPGRSARGGARPRRAVALGFVLGGSALVGACAPPGPALRYEAPSELGAYEILVTRTDFTVRDRVQGGGRPTAYVLSFRFEERDAPRLVWLHVRLADTRTGAIVAAVSAPLDSLGIGAHAQARAVVDALARAQALRPGDPSP
jgi:hypothetical protein